MVGMETEMLMLWKSIKKSTPQIKLKLSSNVRNISLYKNIFFFIAMLMYFSCCGNLKFPLDLNGKSENWHLLLSHCRYFDSIFFFFLFLLSSPPSSVKRSVQIPHFDLLPWQLKGYNVELSFYSCSLRWAIVAHGLLVYKLDMFTKRFPTGTDQEFSCRVR